MDPRETLKQFGPLPKIDGLTVATITYDVAAKDGTLQKMLESVGEVASQIVLVDTSLQPSNAVAALALKFGAHYVRRAWANSFADARNAAMPHVTGAWLLVIDSDEQLTCDRAALIAATQATHADAFAITLENHTEEGVSCMPVIRMFRVSCGLHWVSRLHEYVEGVHSGKMRVGGSVPGARIVHVGHSEAEAQKHKKAENRLELARLNHEEMGTTYSKMVLATVETFPQFAAKLWLEVVNECRAEPFKLYTEGWRRHALVCALAFFDKVAVSYEDAGLTRQAQGAWSKVVDVAAEVRSLMPGNSDLGEIGGADARYFAAKALARIGDYATALDVISPIMGSVKAFPFVFTEGAFTGRMRVYLDALIGTGEVSSVPALCDGLREHYQDGGPLSTDPKAPEMLAFLEKSKATALEIAEKANRLTIEMVGA